ncbi:MAG: dephospho-CoA kinase [Lachnospiraceae bacterium]|nr:dephospho-CoA kinase [Lachnospiraceae bacterium]
MRKIVITGGVGSGKSEVLNFLKENCNCKVVRADDVAANLMSPNGKCYFDIINEFSKVNLLEEGSDKKNPPFDKVKLSKLVFSDDEGRRKVNSIVHPAVKEYILDDVEKCKNEYDYYFLETALAIEEGYDKLFDETWFIYAQESIRSERLKKERGYSDERIKEILSAQMSEDIFRSHATKVIDNNGDENELYHNIRQIIRCE